MRQCTGCGEAKEFKDFYPRKTRPEFSNSPSGYHAKCRDCTKAKQIAYRRNNPEKARDVDLFQNHGIRSKEYNEMYMAQEGCCAACNIHQSGLKRALSVDHNHETGQIRGLLCDKCNVGLGMLQENIKTLENLISYLKHYSELAATNTNVVDFKIPNESI